jgi:uncharacterized protein
MKFKDAAVILDKRLFCIAKARKYSAEAFTNIRDRNELTIIDEERKMNKESIIKIERDYKLLTFDMVLPFGMVGFIAQISKVLAEKKIPIFVISAYSTDHILVKKKYLKKTEAALKSLGFRIQK